MKIELSNGYVLIKEVVTRKIARDYSTALYKDTNMANDGGVSRMNPINFDLASESLVLGLVEKVVLVNKEGAESFIDANREWLDNLAEKDFKKIEVEVLRIRKESDENEKK